jgi:protein involved in polysaccharide export with SLBB domain
MTLPTRTPTRTRRDRNRLHRLVAVSLAALLFPLAGALAQTPAGEPQSPTGLTRAQLARTADSLHASLSTVTDAGDRERIAQTESSIRDRLAEGDFLVGDRLVVSVLGQPQLTDTFTVRQNRELLLPNLPALSLAGVLRSEAQARVAEFVGRYVREPQVTVRPLLRLSVEGAVTRPGFYSVQSDALLSDVIMQAGGPTATSDISHTVIKRDGYLYWGTAFLAPRLYGGATVDALGLRSGDQVVVAEVRQRNTLSMVEIGVSILTAVGMIITLARH